MTGYTGATGLPGAKGNKGNTGMKGPTGTKGKSAHNKLFNFPHLKVHCVCPYMVSNNN